MPAPFVRRRFRTRLTPLAAALAGLVPSFAAHAAGPVVVPPPAANAVPVPNATWRTYGSGNRTGPVNLRNARGGVDQTISQTSQKGIYSWQSFDIGKDSSVTFDMTLPGASALNRVTGSGPSQIFGKLAATNGGEVYLINANGILFGQGAVVNTGSLVASGLDVTDANFKSSLLATLTGGSFLPDVAAFQYAGDAADFIDTRNYVRVDAGATISTASGGRVFLFAKKVENAGTITTPDGQTALAAGSQVFLRLPTDRGAVYAAEENPAVPVLRGLLVEVGDRFADASGLPADVHSGTVTNAPGGVVSTPRGNATLVGLAVNQLGRVSATTSVSENGTIFLRAQAGAAIDTSTSTPVVYATAGGTLTLGPDSRTEILPDTTLVDGKAPTTNDNAGFLASRIDLLGKTVLLQQSAAVVAPGATVNVRAESAPGTVFAPPTVADPEARIVMDPAARIDVAGTTDTVVGVDRYFVTTDLLTSSDLQDAPLQKDGLLYRAKVTVDVRRDSPILGDLARYRNDLERTVGERLSTGGKVDMTAQGAVLLAEGSRIDVSGGRIRATEAMVDPTRLVSATGAVVDINGAPADQLYVMGLNLQKAGLTQYDRWGAVASPGASTPAVREPGYTQGQAAGTLSVDAPTVLMNGTLAARTTVGERQAAGLDALAGTGRLQVGALAGYTGYDGTRVTDPRTLLGDFTIGRAPAAPAGLWTAPLSAALPAHSGVAASAIVDAGFGDVTVVAQGDVALDAGAGLALPDHAHLALDAVTGDASLAGNVTAPGGSVALTSIGGRADLPPGTRIDLSGRWINQFADGRPEDTSAIGGGSFTAQGERGVALGAGSLVDVSGGAAVSQAGALAGGNAGAITLLAGRSLDASTADDPSTARTLVLAGSLRGQALQSAAGGSLSLRSDSVRIGSAAPGAPEAALSLDADFFTQGGFSSFAVEGLTFAEVAPGTQLSPTRTAWWPADTAWQRAATGRRTGDVLASGASPFAPAATVGLALRSSGIAADSVGNAPAVAGGDVRVGQGSLVTLVPGSALSLQAAARVDVEGRIVDHGGSVALTSLGKGRADEANYLWLGRGSGIDVSGTTIVTPSTDGLRHGTVQDGGRLSLTAAGGDQAYATSVVVQQGARLALDGAHDTLDVATRGAGGNAFARQDIATAGGTLAITGTSDLVLEGDVSMRGGGAGAAGGAIAVTLLGARDDFADIGNIGTPAVLPALALVAGRGHASSALSKDDLLSPLALAARNAAGQSNAVLSADWVRASGAADLALAAAETLHVAGDVDLALSRNLVLDAPVLRVDDGASARLAGAIAVLGNARPHADPNGAVRRPPVAAGAGTGRLAIAAQDLVVDGRIALQGAGMLALSAVHDLRLQDSLPADAGTGSLATAGDVAITAGQLYPATGQHFAITAPGHAVTITGGDASLPAPLSAGGSLAVDAATIAQGGVVRAPFGSIALTATQALSLEAGSETSVSGAGLTVSYGATQGDGSLWYAPGDTVHAIAALPDKSLKLTAPAVATAAEATVDLRGGGSVVGYEFIAGPGGSHDVFAGGDGAYAIVPGQQSLAAWDPGFAGQAGLGQQLVVGAGGPVPAGRYTLMPARYALLPGAFLVEPAGGTPLAFGTAIANPDGSSLIGARTASADTSFVAPVAATWRVQPREQALKSSEIRVSSADTAFAGLAAHADLAPPRGAADAGVLQVAAGSADIAGRFRFDAARDANGQAAGLGGVAAFTAGHVVVSNGTAPATADTLTLSASQLDSMAPATLLLGATVGSGTGAGTLAVVAQDVRFENAGHPLSVGDVIAAATGAVTVAPGAAIVAAPTAASGLAPAAAFAIDGDGAALRVANQAGALLTRSAGDRLAGTLLVDAGARLDAGAGSLTLDGTLANTVSGRSTLHAQDIALAAGRVIAGNANAAGTLVLGDALLGQVNGASHLTLRGYDSIALRDGANVGGNQLQSITLDTGRLLAADAQASVTAGEIALVNTTGVRITTPRFDEGQLTLHASAAQGSGRVLIGDGTVAVIGVRSTHLQADRGLVLAGDGALNVSGSLVVRTPRVFAQAPATGAASVANVTLEAHATVDLFAGAPGQPADTAPSAPGAALTLNGARIVQGTSIDLPTGQLTLGATGGIDGNVRFAPGSSTRLAGISRSIDGQAVPTAGGTLAASARVGDVILESGAAIDVSAAGDAAGGKATFSAPAGSVQLAGSLAGTASDPAHGARLVVDAQAIPGLDQFAALQQQASGNFEGSLDLRQRGPGALTLPAGRTLRADTVAIEADGGALSVAGSIDASGTSGGSIALAARDDVVLQAGGRLSVHASADVAQGGRIELTSAQGRIGLAAGAGVDLASDAAAIDADASGGRLTLRAAQSPGGQDVAIDAIGARIDGAAAIDVQAVRAYDGVLHLSSDGFDASPGTLQLSTIAQDSLAFLGAAGANADAIATRIAGGNPGVLAVTRVHAEAEVRSRGNLDLSTPADPFGSDDFVLPTESVDLAATSAHAGDTSLTMRAAGSVRIARTLSAGYLPVYTGSDERAATRVSAHSGNLRIAAGADLGAASAMTTTAAHGNLVVGREDQHPIQYSDAWNIVAVRATSGDVQLAAGRDIDLRTSRTLVYTAGADATDTAAADVRMLLNRSDGAYAFVTGAGNVSLRAGGSVLSNDTWRDMSLPAWQTQDFYAWRSPIEHLEDTFSPQGYQVDGRPAVIDAWTAHVQDYSQPLRFAQHGVASFGGGRVDVSAGQDVVKLAALSPSTGYVLHDVDGGDPRVRVFGGGDVRVQAGRDVVDGLFESGGRQLSVAAGRDVARRESPVAFQYEPGTTVITERGDAAVAARRNVTLGSVRTAFATQGTLLSGLDGDAAASVQAAGGDVDLLLSTESDGNQTPTTRTFAPARFAVSAPAGSIRVGGSAELGQQPGDLLQRPVAHARFDLLAGESVDVDVVAGKGAPRLQLLPTADAGNGPQFTGFVDGATFDTATLDASDRVPAHVAAASGDVTLGDFTSARPVRIAAGRDVTLRGSLDVTHQPERLDGAQAVPIHETSSVQAGRDVVLDRAPQYNFGVAWINGPGEFLLLAGRDIGLGQGNSNDGDLGASGVQAAGNTRNGALPAGSANVTLVAGLRADGSDYDQATLAGFEALGANALTDHAADLYAQLTSAPGAAVALGSAAASAFAAQGLDGQLAQVKALVGAAAYDARLAAFVRTQPGNAGLGDAQALAAFAALPADQRAAAPGVLLGPSFAQQPQAIRTAFVAAVAAATPALAYDDALLAYMARLDGRSRTLAQAVADFEALPQATRIPLLDAVLVSEVRGAGRAAAAATGSDQQAAYDRGYRSISALFPGDRPPGRIEMPEAVAKTLQQGGITLLAPGGGVDAGGVGASAIAPNNLGVVTVGGGDVSAVVRDDFSVNRSRVFTLGEGDILIWSSAGNIDAGRGAKTVVGSPAPVLRVDAQGHLFLDTSGSFTGSGIAVLDAASSLDLYAPVGAIDAGEAGIKSAGNAFFAAQAFIGADNLSVGGSSTGAPPPVSAVGSTVGLASASNVLANAQNAVADDEREQRRKRRARRNLLLEFLGFGTPSQ